MVPPDTDVVQLVVQQVQERLQAERQMEQALATNDFPTAMALVEGNRYKHAWRVAWCWRTRLDKDVMVCILALQSRRVSPGYRGPKGFTLLTLAGIDFLPAPVSSLFIPVCWEK